MVAKEVSQLVLGILPVVYSVLFGHERDLVKVADFLQGIADQLRIQAEPQPLP
ncbi:hypothetical protein [Pseudanabaena sp. 'Roaring Creek']|uniref:hypothetical protein n=1 Tax=Pseudanabaena sp. 'Roaring Creek' TaxID=1681830 RepID=UPI000AAF7D55|nr:hypothetical protein [Pseudanabaena sp. 'Roaring Creek']